MDAETITLTGPVDAHVHLRQPEAFDLVVPASAGGFAAVVAMPNTDPPLWTWYDANAYAARAEAAAERAGFGPGAFAVFPTLYFRPDRLDEELHRAREIGVRAVKFYPKGLTTNSRAGCDPNDPAVLPALEKIAAAGLNLCVHPEAPGYHEDREDRFVPIALDWAERFPELTIVLEHLSGRRILRLLSCPNVYATITPHHLLIDGDDWVGPPLRPHLYCMPVAKRPEDRAALVDAVTRGPYRDKLMLGTDSAPHPVDAKEAACGCAGIFSAPIALPLVAGLFDREGARDRLQAFCADTARRVHRLPPSDRAVTLVRRPSLVPRRIGPYVPMYAGEVLDWSLAP